MYHSQIESAEIQFVTGKSRRGLMVRDRTWIRAGSTTLEGVGRRKSVYPYRFSRVSSTRTSCTPGFVPSGTVREIQNTPFDSGPTCALASSKSGSGQRPGMKPIPSNSSLGV